MEFLKEIKIHKVKYVYETEEEFLQHKEQMEKDGWLSTPYFNPHNNEIKQFCNYDKEI